MVRCSMVDVTIAKILKISGGINKFRFELLLNRVHRDCRNLSIWQISPGLFRKTDFTVFGVEVTFKTVDA